MADKEGGACALIHDRSILLVDEGTSALDQKSADIVEKSLLACPARKWVMPYGQPW